jgi:hypothetical protein
MIEIETKAEVKKQHEHQYVLHECVYEVEAPDGSAEVIVIYDCDGIGDCELPRVWVAGNMVSGAP